MTSNLELLCRKAYSAYADSTGGLNYKGDPMPLWNDLPEGVKTAWGASVAAIVTAIECPDR